MHIEVTNKTATRLINMNLVECIQVKGKDIIFFGQLAEEGYLSERETEEEAKLILEKIKQAIICGERFIEI